MTGALATGGLPVVVNPRQACATGQLAKTEAVYARALDV
jgi:hypothetical protein